MGFRHRLGRRLSQLGASCTERAVRRSRAPSVAARSLGVERLESRAMLSAVSFTGSSSQDFNTLPDAGTSFFYGGLTDLDARPIEAIGMAGWQLYKPAGQSDFVTFISDDGNSASSSM